MERRLFIGFSGVWTPVVLATQLEARRPMQVKVAGEKVVLFRSKGAIGALIDRCPHRGVRLSLGKVSADGCLECPFHAWQFDVRGRVTHVPLNPDAKRERLFATHLEARELGGMIWLYTSTQAPSTEPQLPDGLTRTDLLRTYLQVDWACHWSRAMENMLDSPHVPYVHRTTIGRAEQKYLKHSSKMELTWEPTEQGGHSTMVIDGRDRRASLDFYRPNIMALNIPIPGKVFRIYAISVPQGPTETRMIIVGARDFLPWRILNPLFNFANRIIAGQDRAIVESSDPAEVPPASEELSVATDRVTLQFRKYYHQVLKPSFSAADRSPD
jgi:phenylpropionate dioxygenase-like ring-hydroxylating dioxygenase large terminal subunit